MFQRRQLTIEGQPIFSGHETFPMRYGWLKKAYDTVLELSASGATITEIFNNDEAIAHFGVGRNMVRSIRHWAAHCKVIGTVEQSNAFSTNGKRFFDSTNGLDPYMENPSTLWLLHWTLATNERLATWFSTFNLFHDTEFTRENLVDSLQTLCIDQGWRKIAKSTIKRDVECFIRTYVPHVAKADDAESFFEAPLSDLGLIQGDKSNKFFRIHRGDRPTLRQGVFNYAVLSFWDQLTRTNTLSVDMLLHQPKSPGRVFQLSEEALTSLLLNMEETTEGVVKWSETAGMKQLIRDNSKIKNDLLVYIDIDYK